jgi:2-oxoisovalerate dehydrogenase E2 component (dihydrolipoyl transacylase)
MTIFNLPDLGEGLLEAEIHEWYVKEGDAVEQDQPIVSMETAKAVVDVPAPQSGVIQKRYGIPGSIIKTGAPLIEFQQTEANLGSSTVVGKLEEKQDMNLQHLVSSTASTAFPKATVETKLLAMRLGVDLQGVQGTGEMGLITHQDVEHAHHLNPFSHAKGRKEPLKGVRRQMAIAMQQSHQHIVPVTIYDDADITHWQFPCDITVKLIEAICTASQYEPSLNAWFNGHESVLFDDVNLGLAMDSPDGLFVPVIENAQTKNHETLRQEINSLKKGVAERSLAPARFQNATITLSNFGKFAGKYASPIIVPPMVAILATGRLFKAPKIQDKNLVEAVKIPLSLSFDHRAISGGEATRFLGKIIEALEHNK